MTFGTTSLKNSSLLLTLICLMLLPACTFQKSEVKAVCEKNEEGNYLIKWETFPSIKGMVKIYKSENPEYFATTLPILEVPCSEGFTTIPSFGSTRNYFELVFNKETRTKISNRAINAENIINLRDLGGYYNNDNKQVKWGKIYRSGNLTNLKKTDIDLLNTLNIQTVIDLRTQNQTTERPSLYRAKQYINLPIRGLDIQSSLQGVLSGRIKKGDAFVWQQDLHVALLDLNKDYFKHFFEILSDSTAYPILICCTLGKDVTGIVSALTLEALDIGSEQINQDYILSNSHIDFTKLIPHSDTLSIDVQEALTALLTSQEKTIIYAKKYIEKKHGSVDNYFEKELNLSNKKREKLKDLLLYKEYN